MVKYDLAMITVSISLKTVSVRYGMNKIFHKCSCNEENRLKPEMRAGDKKNATEKKKKNLTFHKK